jgi:hypothetical protein
MGGATSGFVSAVGASGYVTHTAFTNASTSTSVLQVLAYPPGGGDTPMSGSVAFVPAHGMVSYPDVVARLGLPASFTGQLSWTASQPMAAIARDATRDRTVSGVAPVHTLADAASSIAIPYVEDTADFSTTLELSNPGPTTANVTVRFVETGDASGGTPGAEATRDIAIAVNSAAPIADIVRWVRRDASGVRSGKHGFLIVTTPQSVTAHARIVDNSNLDPAIPDNATIASGFSPLVLRVDPLPFSPVGAATTPTSRSRFALSNPGSVPATVHLASFASTGGPPTSHTLDVTIAPHGQYFTDNLGAAMGVPAAFIGWVSLQSTAPVSVYNHRRTGSVGTVVPIHGL